MITAPRVSAFAEELVDWASNGPESELIVTVAWVTRQGAQHTGRHQRYRNEVLSLRIESSVGSAAVEPGQLVDDAVFACVGRTVRELIRHPVQAVRVAALDAVTQHARPLAGTSAVVPAGTSVEKSRARARLVVDLLPAPGDTTCVAVVGVVNSLLAELRERGYAYLPCDLKGGHTQWGEEILRETDAALAQADALLVSGMTLANGTFDALLKHARSTGSPLVVFAQTGSGIFPHLLGQGVSAVSAEPYPFFWLDGNDSRITLHRSTR
ncbi:MAG: DUF364 domain-containing protein [Micropruina sp.]|uniref:Rossmann-like domain-containing protein n=1 Tax=Micropruina sp. TaxID=2737536 RepID=UPI0039E3143E